MRIRKRQVLLSSLQLSPEPLSDPYLINRSPVVVQLRDATPVAPETYSTPEEAPPQHDSAVAAASSLDRYQPSDQPVLPPIGKLTNGSDDPSGIRESGVHKQHNKHHPPLEEDESGASGEKGNHNRKGHIFDSETLSLLSPPSCTQDGRWYDGEEKTIPLKKRRGSFENNDNSNNKKMKTKMNKKCSTQQNDNMEEHDGDELIEVQAKPHVGVGKKRGRGGALMEGSRCSRVNGRGWRCCQQTLVGYSLCEHHLGKGRLRSMTSVRSRSIAAAATTSSSPKKVHDQFSNSDPLFGSSSCSRDEKKETKCVVVVDPLGDDDDDDDDEKKKKKPMMIMSTKKRMKLGMVKARSMSSLLGQTNASTEFAVANSENNNNK